MCLKLIWEAKLQFLGTGEIYENFKRTGQLNGYAGFGETPKTFFEKGYKSASLCYMKFDETYPQNAL